MRALNISDCWSPLSIYNIICLVAWTMGQMKRQPSVWSSFECPKSINLSIYDIICLVAWTMGQMKHLPSVWCSMHQFFSWFVAKLFAKTVWKKSSQFIFLFFNNITKIKIKSFERPKTIKRIKKNNTWYIRLLVNDSFVQSSKQPAHFIVDWRISWEIIRKLMLGTSDA